MSFFLFFESSQLFFQEVSAFLCYLVIVGREKLPRHLDNRTERLQTVSLCSCPEEPARNSPTPRGSSAARRAGQERPKTRPVRLTAMGRTAIAPRQRKTMPTAKTQSNTPQQTPDRAFSAARLGLTLPRRRTADRTVWADGPRRSMITSFYFNHHNP